MWESGGANLPNVSFSVQCYNRMVLRGSVRYQQSQQKDLHSWSYLWQDSAALLVTSAWKTHRRTRQLSPAMPIFWTGQLQAVAWEAYITASQCHLQWTVKEDSEGEVAEFLQTWASVSINSVLTVSSSALSGQPVHTWHLTGTLLSAYRSPFTCNYNASYHFFWKPSHLLNYHLPILEMKAPLPPVWFCCLESSIWNLCLGLWSGYWGWKSVWVAPGCLDCQQTNKRPLQQGHNTRQWHYHQTARRLVLKWPCTQFQGQLISWTVTHLPLLSTLTVFVGWLIFGVNINNLLSLGKLRSRSSCYKAKTETHLKSLTVINMTWW